MDSNRGWCAPNLILTELITFTRKFNTVNLIYKPCNKCLTHTDSIKDLGLHLVTTFFFQSLKMLGLIHALKYSFSTIDSLLLLYFILVRSKLEYALPAGILRLLMPISWNAWSGSLHLHLWVIFFSPIPFHCDPALELWTLHTLQVTSHQFDALFFLFMFFQDQNFVLPCLIIVVSAFLLVI